MKKTFLTLAVALTALTVHAQQDMKTFIDDLMARMTIEEKIGQLNLQVGGDITTGRPQDVEIANLVADGKVGPVAQKLYDNLYGMQTGSVEDVMGWTYKLF